MKNNILLLTLCGLIFNSFAQTKKWEMQIGYEQVFLPKKEIQGSRSGSKSFKEAYFHDSIKGDLAYVSSGGIQSPLLTIQYNHSARIQFYGSFKQYFRKFIVWDANFVEEGKGYKNANENQFNIARSYGRLGIRRIKDGPLIRTGSFQLGATVLICRRKLFNKNLEIGISNSLNFDNYEKSQYAVDSEYLYISEDQYAPSSGYATVNSITEIDGRFNTYNPFHVLPFTISFNHAINVRFGLSEKFDFAFQLGYRNIHLDVIYPYKNMHLEYNLEFLETSPFADEPDSYTYKTSIFKRLPIQIGGVYTNVSLVFYPFVK